jgi:hypothetical protein
MTTMSVGVVVRLSQFFADAAAVGDVLKPRIEGPLPDFGIGSESSILAATPTGSGRSDLAGMLCPPLEVCLEIRPIRSVQVDFVVLSTERERNPLDRTVILGAVPRGMKQVIDEPLFNYLHREGGPFINAIRRMQGYIVNSRLFALTRTSRSRGDTSGVIDLLSTGKETTA